MKHFKLKPVIGRSLKLAWKNKKLWLFGFFIGGSLAVMQYSGGKWQEFKEKISLFSWENIRTILLDGQILSNVSVVLLFLLAIYILTAWARGGILAALAYLKKGQNKYFKVAAKTGWSRLFRLFLIDLFFGAIGLFLFVLGAEFLSGSYRVLSFVAIGVWLIMTLLLFLSRHYIYCAAIYEDKGVFPAIKSGVLLYFTNFKKLTLVKVVEIGLWLLSGLAIALILFISLIPFTVVGLVLMLGFNILPIKTLGLLVFIVLMIIFLIARSIANIFIYSYLTEVYWLIKQ